MDDVGDDELLFALRSAYRRQTLATGNCAKELSEKYTDVDIEKLQNDIIVRAMDEERCAQAVPPKPIHTDPKQLSEIERGDIKARLEVARKDLKMISEEGPRSLNPNEIRRNAVAGIGQLAANLKMANLR